MSKSRDLLFQKIIDFFEGEFDNFQQTWQENTEDDIHRVEVEEKHRHIHTVFEKQHVNFNLIKSVSFILKHYVNKNHQKIIAQHVLEFVKNDTQQVILTKFYPLIADGKVSNSDNDVEKIIWKANGSIIEGISESGNTNFKIENKQLLINQQEGFFAHKIPYRMIKCRFFSGWIEYPNPENPENIFRMKNLQIHDQGGIIPMTFEDGKVGPYTVELTQLVFAKKLPIMKLAVYEQPFETIDYNSKAISYTWTNPTEKRVGINLRKVLTGWTFIEPGFISSNNQNWEEEA